MEENKITALAREYAEECCPESDYKEDIEWRKEDIKHETSCTEAFLTWLLRRFCLVEKERAKDEYHEAKFACGNVDPCSETWATYQAQKSVLERLFPDLGKEVEG